MATGTTVANVRDVIPDLGGQVDLDEHVLLALPPNCLVEESITYSTAVWTRASRITVRLDSGGIQQFFLKCASEEQGRVMIEGEFASMKELYRWSPLLVPKPYAQGTFKDAAYPTYFFLMEFLEIDTGAPDPSVFCKQLASLHRESQSPECKFGFHITTCHGPTFQDTTWDDDWTLFFTRLLRQFYRREVDIHGASTDGIYEELFDKLVTYVVPALLRPLQSEGRSIKPSLVHGDLWEENSGTDLHNGQPKIFDAAVLYAHHEYELGMWRREIIRFGRTHIRHYLMHMPPSEPKEQWDDRNRLYSIKFELGHSIGWPATAESQRDILLRDMRYLVDKYGAKGSQAANPSIAPE